MPRPQQVRRVDHVQRAKAKRGLPERAPGGLTRAAPARAAGGRAQARRAHKARRQRPGGAPLGWALARTPPMAQSAGVHPSSIGFGPAHGAVGGPREGCQVKSEGVHLGRRRR